MNANFIPTAMSNVETYMAVILHNCKASCTLLALIFVTVNIGYCYRFVCVGWYTLSCGMWDSMCPSHYSLGLIIKRLAYNISAILLTQFNAA